MGIVISYSIRVKLNCGTLSGELITDVPFKLMHPAPGISLENISYIFIRQDFIFIFKNSKDSIQNLKALRIKDFKFSIRIYLNISFVCLQAPLKRKMSN